MGGGIINTNSRDFVHTGKALSALIYEKPQDDLLTYVISQRTALGQLTAPFMAHKRHRNL